jgi:hypothetical protein
MALGPFSMGGGGWMSPKSGLNHDSQKVTPLGSAWSQITILHFVNRSLLELLNYSMSFCHEMKSSINSREHYQSVTELFAKETHLQLAKKRRLVP